MHRLGPTLTKLCGGEGQGAGTQEITGGRSAGRGRKMREFKYSNELLVPLQASYQESKPKNTDLTGIKLQIASSTN